MHLPEDDLLLFAMDGAPDADAPLQGAANAAAQFGMAPDHLLEDGDRPKARRPPSASARPRLRKYRPADRAGAVLADAFLCEGSLGSFSMR